MDVFQKLRSSPDLTENDRAIVSCILDNPEWAAHATARAIAQCSHTSPSAVTRLVDRLGFATFDDLRLSIATDLKQARAGTADMAPGERALSAAAKLAQLEATVIAETRRTLDLDALQRAADLLAQADEIDICARNTNAVLANYAAALFSSAGHLTNVRSNVEFIISQTLLAPKGHACLLISRGGADPAISEVSTAHKEKGIPTVAITTAPDSPLAHTCDAVLFCHYAEFKPIGQVVFHLSASYVINCLFMMLFSGDMEDNIKALDQHFEMASNRIYRDDGWNPEDMLLV